MKLRAPLKENERIIPIVRFDLNSDEVSSVARLHIIPMDLNITQWQAFTSLAR